MSESKFLKSGRIWISDGRQYKQGEKISKFVILSKIIKDCYKLFKDRVKSNQGKAKKNLFYVYITFRNYLLRRNQISPVY